MKKFWDRVYRNKTEKSVSWYKNSLTDSLQLIENYCPSKTSNIIDVGAGRSSLAIELVQRGYQNISIFDISSEALKQNQNRLEKHSDLTSTLVGDITEIDLPKNKFDLWHDRALFHFFNHEQKRRAYKNQLSQSLKPQGLLSSQHLGQVDQINAATWKSPDTAQPHCPKNWEVILC